MAEDGRMVTEKNKFNVNDLRPRSGNERDLQYSHIFSNSVVSEKSTISVFPKEKPKLTEIVDFSETTIACDLKLIEFMKMCEY